MQYYSRQLPQVQRSTTENSASAGRVAGRPISWPSTRRPQAHGSSSRPRILLTPGNVTLGLIVKYDSANVSRGSIVEQQKHVNFGADGHPLCIIGTKDNGNICVVLQVTTLKGQTVQQKYWKEGNAMRLQYLAIQHYNDTEPHNDLPVLHLANGMAMEKQSYVHLDHFFEIETAYLEQWYDGQTQLDAGSLTVAYDQLRRLVQGITPRLPPADSRPMSPIDTRLIWTAQDFGIARWPSHAVPIIAPPSPRSVRTANSSESIAPATPPSVTPRDTQHDSVRSWRSNSNSPQRDAKQNASGGVAVASPQTSPRRATQWGNGAVLSRRERSPPKRDLDGWWRR